MDPPGLASANLMGVNDMVLIVWICRISVATVAVIVVSRHPQPVQT